MISQYVCEGIQESWISVGTVFGLSQFDIHHSLSDVFSEAGAV